MGKWDFWEKKPLNDLYQLFLYLLECLHSSKQVLSMESSY